MLNIDIQNIIFFSIICMVMTGRWRQ